MAGKIVGIDLGGHEIKVALVSSGLRGAQVHGEFAFASTHAGTTPNERALARVDEVLTALRRRGWHHHPVCLAVPGGLASFRSLRFPFTDPRRITQTLAFQLDDEFPRPLSELEHDSAIVVGQGTVGATALVVALDRALVDAILAKFEQAGVELRLLTVVPLAMAQLLAGPVLPARTGAVDTGTDRPIDAPPARPAALVVDLGADGTDLLILGDRGPLAVRSLRRGGRHMTVALRRHYGFDDDAAEQAKLERAFLPHKDLGVLEPEVAASGEVMVRAFEPILREIEHTRLWARAELGIEVSELRLTGSGSRLRGLEMFLREQLDLPVHEARPAHAAWAKLAPERGWTSSAALAAALAAAARKPLIKLGQGTKAEREDGWLLQHFGSMVALACAILAMVALDTWVRGRALDAERELFLAELEAITSRNLGESLSTRSDVEDLLAGLDASEDEALIPERGALEVLELLSAAAAPSDPAPPIDPSAGAPVEAPDGDGLAGETSSTGDPADTGEPVAEAPPAVPAAPAPTIDINAGIVHSDQLEFQMVDIRELKIQLKLTATRAAAQDRLAIRLEQLGCISNVQKGRVTDRDNRKVFEMSMDHNCFRATHINRPKEGGGAT